MNLYYNLRDYGTAQWDGGDLACDHSKDRSIGIASSTLAGGKSTTNHQQEASYRDTCGTCGARRIDRQIGLEATPDCGAWATHAEPCGSCYVCTMRVVFREVWRVLRDDGVVFLNLGDSYFGTGKGPTPPTGLHGQNGTPYPTKGVYTHPVLKPKDLIGIPWRVAFALQADGWWLRSDIIWAKPNPMPESVTDRPTRSHEYVFLLSKSERYYYDQDAVREGWADERNGSPGGHKPRERNRGGRTDGFTSPPMDWVAPEGRTGRNRRTVWTIATQPYSGAHFATFPEKLVEPCILAGSSPQACEQCGAPWRRVVEPSPAYQKILEEGRQTEAWKADRRKQALQVGVAFGDKRVSTAADYVTTGWQPTCACPDATGRGRCVVLDPFAGSGTVARVALKHGRDAVLIELNPSYLDLADTRTDGIQTSMESLL